MFAVTFPKVGFLSEENKWNRLKFLAWDDIGTLTVSRERIEFVGRKADFCLSVNEIKRLSLEKQGRDFINKWVKVEYNGGSVFFIDAGFWGYAGYFGGTEKILDAAMCAVKSSLTLQQGQVVCPPTHT